MKKSFVNRTLQIASAVAIYSAISIWSSTAHVDMVTNTITSLNSLLVILAIAVAFPYFCFNVLAKLYTPPKVRNLDDNSTDPNSVINQNEVESDLERRQYRGTHYSVEDMPPIDNDRNIPKPAIKYRGASIANTVEETSQTQNTKDTFSTERESQKSAKPKERIKYRGSYVD